VKNYPIYAPNTVFRLGNVAKKSVNFFGAAPYPKGTSGGCQKGDVPPYVWGVLKGAVVPLIAKKILDCERLKMIPGRP
jgi:hypothetical protein